MRHERILDVAADNPNASVGELADEVPSATADLVENVLEKYGDPADTTDTDPTPPESPRATDETPPSPADLSAVERETLEAIHEHPEATQRELSDQLGVSPATISNRVNGIPGFEWAERTTYTRRRPCLDAG